MRALFITLGTAVLAGVVSCSQSAVDKMPDIRLPTYAASEGQSLASCPAAKCLTAYVAPWCGYCRSSTPMLMALRGYLERHGVAMRFIVGKDRLPALRAYAREFGPDTMLDVDDAVAVGGVPHFFVSDQHGVILRQISGVPSSDNPIEDIAASFGLP
ncbi:MAG TPA: hypothetical protein DEB40_08500 [Elusimicrobia bacterium]|nr:hypothetical protein [Elusimicrobiota bacterium]HBT61767.1 hypothetical protein [Elusimicrobiota bacterium]